MSRAQFDRNDVIDKAIQVFWEKGFSQTSIQQIVSATGLKPGSLYLAFENKEGLFKEALSRYTDGLIQFKKKMIDSAPSVGKGIVSIFETLIQDAEKEEYNSCFLVKTQLELSASGNHLYTFAAEKLADIENLYRNYLSREWPPQTSKAYATSIMLHIFGIQVYAYHAKSPDHIKAGLQNGLPWLPWETTH